MSRCTDPMCAQVAIEHVHEAATVPARPFLRVDDAPGMLRVRLREDQVISGSGNNFAVVPVVAEHAERAAFARQALAVKLRELDARSTPPPAPR